jgi:hypothetical protein
MDQATLALLPGMLTTLNVVLSLFAVFFFTSTLASHILEALAGWINSRGKQQREQLEQALVQGVSPIGDNNPNSKEMIEAIYGNPLIASIASTKSVLAPLAVPRKSDAPRNSLLRPPSYIEPELLAHAIGTSYSGNKDLQKKSAPSEISRRVKKY